ncbi:MAG: HAMP domain-containing histidine kinase [Spirochaetia bacterium]|nr:HAMP domain-containing histidine kinase [Spirochaetia bacterium]
MNILSFCKNLNYQKYIEFEVVQVYEDIISDINISSKNFHAILVDDFKTIKLIIDNISKNEKFSIPVIMLLKSNATYVDFRYSIDSGATDFSVEPYKDLKEIIVRSYMRLDELSDSSEAKLNQLRRTLINSIPHELNTPLTSIIGLASVMAKEDVPDAEGYKEFCINIYNSAKRLQKVIDNFTYYSYLQLKLSSNSDVSFARSFTVSNPEQVIKLVIHDLQYTYHREIKFSVSAGSIQFNATNFYKLVYYLLENALKFSKNDSLVMVGAYPLEKEYQLVIYNEDSGFDPDQLNYIGALIQFDRGINEQQGIGMGIAIVLSLLKLYDGRIKIISEKKKFTKMEVFLKNNINNQVVYIDGTNSRRKYEIKN